MLNNDSQGYIWGKNPEADVVRSAYVGLGNKWTDWNILVLQAYIDDSKDQERKSHLVLAGYIADAQTWANFSVEWAEHLKHFSFDEFKASKMPNDYPEYTSSFYRIIENHIKYSVSCRVDLTDFYDIVGNLPDKYKNTPVGLRLKNPYFIASKYLMVFLYEKLGHLMNPEPIDIIFDEQKGEDKVLIEAFNYLKYCLQNADNVGSMPVFKDSKNFMPLQAADLLANQLKRALDNGLNIDKDKVLSFDCKKDIHTLNISISSKDIKNDLEFIFSDENFEQIMRYDGYIFIDDINPSFILEPVSWLSSS